MTSHLMNALTYALSSTAVPLYLVITMNELIEHTDPCGHPLRSAESVQQF